MASGMKEKAFFFNSPFDLGVFGFLIWGSVVFRGLVKESSLRSENEIGETC